VRQRKSTSKRDKRNRVLEELCLKQNHLEEKGGNRKAHIVGEARGREGGRHPGDVGTVQEPGKRRKGNRVGKRVSGREAHRGGAGTTRRMGEKFS